MILILVLMLVLYWLMVALVGDSVVNGRRSLHQGVARTICRSIHA